MHAQNRPSQRYAINHFGCRVLPVTLLCSIPYFSVCFLYVQSLLVGIWLGSSGQLFVYSQSFPLPLVSNLFFYPLDSANGCVVLYRVVRHRVSTATPRPRSVRFKRPCVCVLMCFSRPLRLAYIYIYI